MAKSKVSKTEQTPSDKSIKHVPDAENNLSSLQPDLPVISKPGTATASTAGHGSEGNGRATITMAASATPAANGHIRPELAEKIKELVRLSQEQGYLTYNDINDALPENVATAQDLDEVLIKLRNLEVEIVDQA